MKQGVLVGVAVLVAPPGVFVGDGVPGVAVGHGTKQPGSQGTGSDDVGVSVTEGVAVMMMKQGVGVGVSAPPGVSVGSGVTGVLVGVDVGHGMMQPGFSHGQGVGVLVFTSVGVGHPSVGHGVGVSIGGGVGVIADAVGLSFWVANTSNAADASPKRIAKRNASLFTSIPPGTNAAAMDGAGSPPSDLSICDVSSDQVRAEGAGGLKASPTPFELPPL